jgi:hypothetical protein
MTQGWSKAPARSGRIMLVAALTSLVVVGGLVVSRSRAAFSDATTNDANSFAAGTITLADDDSGSALFNVSDMLPGDAASVGCIVVTYSGSAPDPGAVTLYSGGFTDSGDFADYLDVTVEEGDGGAFGNCTGFVADATIESGGTLSDFDANHTDWTSGAGAWDPSTSPESKTYRISVQLDAAAPNAEQGESVTGLTFTWEIQG